MTQRFCDKSGEPLSLVLYMFDECPFCQRVLSAMGALGFDLPMRNIRKDLSAREIALGAWSLVHGLASLASSGRVPVTDARVRRYADLLDAVR